MIKFKIKNVDMYGFQGRDFHPSKSDIGLVVTMISAHSETGERFGENEFFESSWEDLNRIAKDKEDPCFQVLHCITEDGRKLTLIDFEVEFVS